jgi:hypothetical protein
MWHSKFDVPFINGRRRAVLEERSALAARPDGLTGSAVPKGHPQHGQAAVQICDARGQTHGPSQRVVPQY